MFVNADGDMLWYMYQSNKSSAENFEEVVKAYIQGYADKGISDLLLCCAGQTVGHPSKVMMWMGDKYYQKQENGVPVDYTGHHRIKNLVEIYEKMQNPKRECDEDRDMAKMLRDSEYYAYEFTAGKGNVREIVVTGNGTLKYLEIKIEE